jgi:hypothetical protein
MCDAQNIGDYDATMIQLNGIPAYDVRGTLLAHCIGLYTPHYQGPCVAKSYALDIHLSLLILIKLA